MQLAKDGYLDEMGVKLLGTDAEAIDKAEDRQMFRDTMVKINQPVVPSDIAYTVDHAKEIASDIGYPVIIRPAFTLGGAGGGVAYNEHELEVIAKNGLLLSPITIGPEPITSTFFMSLLRGIICYLPSFQ